MENQKTGAAVYGSFSNQRLGYEGQVAVRTFCGTIFLGPMMLTMLLVLVLTIVFCTLIGWWITEKG
jgi:hypothetical protein